MPVRPGRALVALSAFAQNLFFLARSVTKKVMLRKQYDETGMAIQQLFCLAKNGTRPYSLAYKR
jgi:hypothetical protein